MGSYIPFLHYDGAPISATSSLGKELMKWERKSDYRPENHPYPKMMYRAQHRPDGRRSVGEVSDHHFMTIGPNGERIIQPGAAEQWTARCQITVQDELGRQRALEQGYRDTAQEALDFAESRDNMVANITAERHAADARMSEPAQREAAAADQTTLRHLPEIPEKKVRCKPGPKPKVQVAEG